MRAPGSSAAIAEAEASSQLAGKKTRDGTESGSPAASTHRRRTPFQALLALMAAGYRRTMLRESIM
jgi:hypothetical protein